MIVKIRNVRFKNERFLCLFMSYNFINNKKHDKLVSIVIKKIRVKII